MRLRVESGKTPSASIVLATYNERENIEKLIPALAEKFADVPHEIIVVDDSSPDGTGEAALRLAKTVPNVKLITRKRKVGIGAALREGYDRSLNDIILSCDADSFSPEDVRKIYQKTVGEGYDIVVGSRYIASKENQASKSRLPMSAAKYVISVVGNKALRWLFRIPISDFSMNCRAVRKDAWSRIHPKDNGNFFLFEMLFLAHKNGARIGDVYVNLLERKYGSSKVNKVYIKELFKALYKLTVLLFRR